MLPGQDKKKHLDQIRKDIRDFKAANKLDKVIVLPNPDPDPDPNPSPNPPP